MKSIEELALKVAAEMDDVYLRNVPAVTLCDFATRFLSAHAAQQEPVAWMRTSGHGAPVVTEEFLLKYPEYRYEFNSPLYHADQLAAVVQQRDELLSAAQAVVDRWDAPLWKDTPSTAEVINALRAAIAKVQP